MEVKMSYSLIFKDGAFLLSNVEHFSPELIFDCGQCFRFDKISKNTFAGVAFSRYVSVEDLGGGSYRIGGFKKEDSKLLREFFCLDEDYDAICQDILDSMEKHGLSTDIMKKAMEVGRGIRILHQDPFECICSFIISQNNNIPRIKKIIDRLCRELGESFEQDGGIYHAFPDGQSIEKAGLEVLSGCGTGFRNKYLLSAAEIMRPDRISQLCELGDKDLEDALMQVKGIGPKVSSCIALFGFGRASFFPIDVWMRKVLDKYYPEVTSGEVFGKYAGIAQQYLFYFERYTQST